MGGAAAAGGMDSGGYAALGGDVGAGFDEDAVFPAQALPDAAREVFCDECFGSVAGTDSSCLQIQEVEHESLGGATNYRDHRGSVKGGGFDPAAVATSDGHEGDARGESTVGGSGESEGPGKTLRGLRGEQENDSARVSGGNKNEFWQVATATTVASRIATAGFGRKGNSSGFGCRL